MTDQASQVVQQSTLRVLSADGSARGGAVLISDKRQPVVVTAAHVVNLALGRAKGTRTQPTEPVTLDFPFLGGAQITARVERWKSPAREDIATLVLEGALPASAKAALISVFDSTILGAKSPEHGIRIFGFPADNPEGIWASGRVSGVLASQLVQIDDDRLNGIAIQEGFSGCAVWSKRDELLGVVLKATKRARVAAYAPANLISPHLAMPDDGSRGTETWKLRYFRYQGINALLNDLEEMEQDGLDDEECALIRTVLGRICNYMSGLDGTAEWEVPLHKDMEVLRDHYVTWNNQDRPENRREALNVLRNQRNQLSGKIAQTEGLLLQEDLDEMIDDIFEALGSVAATYPKKFPNVGRAASTYRRRAGLNEQAS